MAVNRSPNLNLICAIPTLSAWILSSSAPRSTSFFVSSLHPFLVTSFPNSFSLKFSNGMSSHLVAMPVLCSVNFLASAGFNCFINSSSFKARALLARLNFSMAILPSAFKTVLTSSTNCGFPDNNKSLISFNKISLFSAAVFPPASLVLFHMVLMAG